MGFETLVAATNQMFLFLCTGRVAAKTSYVFFMFLAEDRIVAGEEKFK